MEVKTYLWLFATGVRMDIIDQIDGLGTDPGPPCDNIASLVATPCCIFHTTLLPCHTVNICLASLIKRSRLSYIFLLDFWHLMPSPASSMSASSDSQGLRRLMDYPQGSKPIYSYHTLVRSVCHSPPPWLKRLISNSFRAALLDSPNYSRTAEEIFQIIGNRVS